MMKAVFCDLDGTLVDTKRANFLAYQAAAHKHGQSFTAEHFVETWGKDSRDFLPLLYPQLSAIEVESIQKDKANLYPTYFDKTRINKGLLKTLTTLGQNGIQLGLVTTAKRRSLGPLLKHHKIDSLFQFSVSGDDVDAGKPHPEAYLKALKIAGCKAVEAVAFEDSSEGLKSAQAAGLSVVRVIFEAGDA